MHKKLILTSILLISLVFTRTVLAQEFTIKENAQCSAVKGKITCQDKEEEKRLTAKCRVEKGRIVCPAEEQKTTEQPQHLEFGHAEESKVYSSSNMPENIKTSPSSIDVITLDEMETQHNPPVRDMMNQLPGVTVQDQGSIGDMESVRIRGWDKVSLTLDGMRIDDPSMNKVFLNHFLTDGIDRIEVIKGPQSTIHGNRAQGGIVSMFTRQGVGSPSVEFTSGMGAHATFKETLNFQGGNESADYYLGITRLDTHGGMMNQDLGRVHHDGYNNLAISNNLGKRILKGKAEVRNTFRYIEDEKEIGLNEVYDFMPPFPLIGFTLDKNDRALHSDVLENLTFTHAPTNWYDYFVKFGAYEARQKNIGANDSDNPFDNYYSKYYNTRLMMTTQHNLKYKDYNTLAVGYNLEYNHFNNKYSDDFADDSIKKDLSTNDVYFQDTINLKDILIVKSGLRISHSSNWGTYGIPSVSGALILPTLKIPGSYTKVKSSYGIGVNYPSAFQLFGTSWGTSVGNPDLTPEKVGGWDVGVVQSFFNDKVNLECTYFDNNFKDLITQPGWGLPYENINEAYTNGLETSLKIHPLPGLKGQVNYTYTNAKDGDDQVLPGIAGNRWNYTISYEPGHNYSVYTKATSSSSRKYLSYLDDRVKGFFNLAIGTTFKIFEYKDVKLYVWGELNNILNQHYQTYKGYQNPGITFLAGISLKREF